MKHKLNQRRNTLENLENNYWEKPDFDSQLIIRCHALRKIPLNNFTVEDLRLMIGQQIGLYYLIPMALEFLAKDLFAEGDYFEGDLLKNVLAIRTEFWVDNKNYCFALNDLIMGRRDEIKKKKFDIHNFDNAVRVLSINNC